MEMAVISMIARWLLLIGGGVLLLLSLFGLLPILVGVLFVGEPFSIRDVPTVLCLLLPFPMYLIGLKSLRIATFTLWSLFIVQWLIRCFISHPPTLLNPFDWWHGEVLFFSIVFVQVGYLILSRASRGRVVTNLYDVFERID